MKNTNIKSKSSLPEKLVVNGTELHDKHDIANHLNKHFVQKGPNLASKLPNVETSIYKTMGQRNPCSMILNDTSDSEVVSIGSKFDINKSTGVHNIPAVLIKWAIYIIAPILAKFFNIFMRLGIYPDTLKVAKVTPLHKKGDKTVDDNYRSISVLTQINKIFEKIIHERLVSFINEHSLLPNNQFGYRKKTLRLSWNHSLKRTGNKTFGIKENCSSAVYGFKVCIRHC